MALFGTKKTNSQDAKSAEAKSAKVKSAVKNTDQPAETVSMQDLYSGAAAVKTKNAKNTKTALTAVKNIEAHRILVSPLVTEKATNLSEENKYVFIVAKEANKQQIKTAVEEIFKVNVLKVHTVNMPGKLKRVGAHSGCRPDYKKATVKIKSGQSIKIAEGA